VHVEQGVDRRRRLLAAYPPIALERVRSAPRCNSGSDVRHVAAESDRCEASVRARTTSWPSASPVPACSRSSGCSGTGRATISARRTIHGLGVVTFLISPLPCSITHQDETSMPEVSTRCGHVCLVHDLTVVNALGFASVPLNQRD